MRGTSVDRTLFNTTFILRVDRKVVFIIISTRLLSAVARDVTECYYMR